MRGSAIKQEDAVMVSWSSISRKKRMVRAVGIAVGMIFLAGSMGPAYAKKKKHPEPVSPNAQGGTTGSQSSGSGGGGATGGNVQGGVLSLKRVAAPEPSNLG